MTCLKTCLYIILILLIQSGCYSSPINVVENKVVEDDVLLKIELKKLKLLDSTKLGLVGNKKSTYVFGNVLITGLKKQTSVNLNCIAIVLDSVKSESIYVDSVAHFTTDNFKVSGGKVDVDVCWFFKNYEIDKNIDQFNILVKNNCLIK